MKTCSHCKELKELKLFQQNKKTGNYESWCRPCKNKVGRVRYADSRKKTKDAIIARNKAFIRDYLQENPCVDCGESDIEVLEFDHILPVGKTARRIPGFMTYSQARILQEIQLCEVRCSNCHTRKTRRLQGWSRM